MPGLGVGVSRVAAESTPRMPRAERRCAAAQGEHARQRTTMTPGDDTS